MYLNGAVYAKLNGSLRFQNNRALLSGAGVYLNNGSVIEINTSDAIFSHNTAYVTGGAIFAGSGCAIVISGTASFVNNSATSSVNASAGGALFVAGGTVAFSEDSSLTFKDSFCLGSGGVVALVQGSKLQASGSLAFSGTCGPLSTAFVTCSLLRLSEVRPPLQATAPGFPGGPCTSRARPWSPRPRRRSCSNATAAPGRSGGAP